jgi:hypothetical protein
VLGRCGNKDNLEGRLAEPQTKLHRIMHGRALASDTAAYRLRD